MKEAWSKFQFQFRVFLTLTKRHILVFSKNWTTVLFTMMVPVVIFIVYIVFLRNMMIDGIKTALPIFDQLVEDQQQKIYALADCWMMAGVLAVSCITVSLNTNYIMVRDKERGANRDFISSPISSRMVMVSYFAFNTIVCFVVNFLVLCLCMIYLAAYGAFMIDFVDFLALVGIILLSTMNAALLTFFVCNFINTESTLSSIVAIASAAVGFVIGAYFPATGVIQKITVFFPGTYSASLFRNYFMSGPLSQVISMLDSLDLPGIDISEISEILMGQFGLLPEPDTFSFVIDFFGNDVPVDIQAWVLAAFTGIFAVLNLAFTYQNFMKFPKLKKAKKKN